MEVNRYHHTTDAINRLKLTVKGISYASIDTHWNFDLNIYPYNVLYYIRSGIGKIRLASDSEYTDLLPGNIYIIPCNTAFSAYCPSKMEKMYISVNILNEFDIDIFNNFNRIISIPIEISHINELTNLMNSTISYDLLMLKSEIYSTVSRFVQIAVNEYNLNCLSNIDYKYFQIIEYIQRNISVTLKINDIASVFNYNTASLSRDFKANFGVNLKQYIDNLILQQAIDLLISSTLSIQEIAEKLGFSDRSYFSRYFKKHARISPSDYRRCKHIE